MLLTSSEQEKLMQYVVADLACKEPLARRLLALV
jgi:hypothetical protein